MMNHKVLMSVVAALVMSLISSSSALSCKDQSGNDIDYWFAIKDHSGTNYWYYTENDGIVFSQIDMDSKTEGMLAYTLKQVWDDENIEYIFFNDEPTQGSSSETKGHTKGVWLWDPSTGEALILSHSLPKFPEGPSQTSSYPGLGDNADDYGQDFACFTVSLVTLNSVAISAQLNAPQVYDYQTSAKTPSSLAALATGTVNKDARCAQISISTVGGLQITYFAKSRQWNSELYSMCVAPGLAVGLSVESWLRGDEEGPACGTYPVLDINQLEYSSSFDMKESQDHSKWAVGDDYVCACDINRMTSQFKRGGGCFCFQNSKLSEFLENAITASDSCGVVDAKI